MRVHFEGNEEAPAEVALKEGGEENSAGSCQLSSEIKGENLPSVTSWLLLLVATWMHGFHKNKK